MAMSQPVLTPSRAAPKEAVTLLGPLREPGEDDVKVVSGLVARRVTLCESASKNSPSAHGDGAALDLGQAHAADHVVDGERTGEVVLVREHEQGHARELGYREERVQLRRRGR